MDRTQVEQMEANKRAIIEDNTKTITSEVANRNFIINLATAQGCEQEARQILNRYDGLLRNCSNPVEKKHIAIMGMAEMHKLLNCSGALVVDGVEILPASGKIREIIQ